MNVLIGGRVCKLKTFNGGFWKTQPITRIKYDKRSSELIHSDKRILSIKEVQDFLNMIVSQLMHRFGIGPG